ncbi:MAG: hypothetical protein HYY55_01635 [Candidatus Niyogibacteria bacterium]|nr:MAG: hypothetical protein HYY55_01635 [Candidatus Niyogibacteria bacterium]
MKKIIWIILLAVILAAVFVFIFWPKESVEGKYDDFAQCLTDRGVVMYGAYWCPHCQNEKKAFAGSFRLVNYVECTEETDKCLAEKINGYPTWILSDGRRFEGETGLEKLSEASGCLLENKK